MLRRLSEDRNQASDFHGTKLPRVGDLRSLDTDAQRQAHEGFKDARCFVAAAENSIVVGLQKVWDSPGFSSCPAHVGARSPAT